MQRIKLLLERQWWLFLLVVVLAGYWLLPVSGQVLIFPGVETTAREVWPRLFASVTTPQPGDQLTLWVQDREPWGNVYLTANGQPATLLAPQQNPDGSWTWAWRLTMPDAPAADVRFYHDCHEGCRQRGQFVLGAGSPPAPQQGVPTKLGLVFANPDRNWHGRSGWVVDLSYAQLPDDPRWGLDALAERVYHATQVGQRVLVRVEYDRRQSLPPTNDFLALRDYLAHLERIARDDRFDGVYGYVIGSDVNSLDSNRQNPSHAVTPEWYARIFNGYGEPVSANDNAVQVIRAVRPDVRVLVGTIRPWSSDQDGTITHEIDVPWLNYMNTLVARVDASTRAKAKAGIAGIAPDGFALQAPGRPNAPELAGRIAAREPAVDLHREAWKGAQAGFRVYED